MEEGMRMRAGFLAALLSVQLCIAANYYVAPEGTGEECSVSSPCALSHANTILMPGDTALLQGGTYDTHIFPARSGSFGEPIAYEAHNDEKPVIRNNATAYATYYHGILLRDRSYVRIKGITVELPPETAGKGRLMMITHGSSYNEIAGCTLNGTGNVQIWDGGSTPHPSGTPCVHNWIHGCTIANTGRVNAACDDLGGMQIGVPGYDDHSSYNTIESNIFYCGGHHNLETFTKYNVIRNNHFRHEGCMSAPNPPCPYGPDQNGLHGNRNLQVYDGYGSQGTYNLVEGNRFGHSGPPPDDDGGDGLTITAPRNIIRHNYIFNSQNNGLLMKMGSQSYSHENRVYSNTIFKSGAYRNSGPQWQGHGIRFYPSTLTSAGNVIKNNIIFDSAGSDITHTDKGGGTENNNILEANWLSADGDPMFVNPDLSDPRNPLLPNLSLRSGSGAIDMGVHLTTVAASDQGTGPMIVEDALYFQDGWGSVLSGVQPDWVAVGTQDNAVQIASIDYAANTITLAAHLERSPGDSVWLYKDSSGRVVLYGAPDIGAYELLCEEESDACPDMMELLHIVRSWREGSLSMPELMQAVSDWKSCQNLNTNNN